MSKVNVDISIGEAVDKLTILNIKFEMTKNDPESREFVKAEREVLIAALESYKIDPLVLGNLMVVNRTLWDLEDEIRSCEARKDFGQEFIETARSIYLVNDLRFQLKKMINERYNSDLVEIKVLPKYEEDSK